MAIMAICISPQDLAQFQFYTLKKNKFQVHISVSSCFAGILSYPSKVRTG